MLGTRFFIAALLSCALITLDYSQQHLGKLHSSLSVVVIPIQTIARLPFNTVAWLHDNLQRQRTLLKANQTLKQQQQLLQYKVLKLDAIEAENDRLHLLLSSTPNQTRQKVGVAKLLAIDPEPYSQRIILDKGTQQDAYVGQPILDAFGVMGQIIAASPYTSTALLITDERHALPVQNNRTGLRSIAVGTGYAGSLELMHVTSTSDSQVGDLLVTSGLGQRFPAGFPVGVIDHIEHEPSQPFAKITVLPTAHLDSSVEVLFIWPEENSFLAEHSQPFQFESGAAVIPLPEQSG